MMIPWFLLNRCRCSTTITWSMLRGCCALTFVYNIQAYLWYLSLNATIAAINNAIAQSAVAVAYILSVILLPNYNMSWIKNIGVLCCLTGVAVVGYGTLNESDDQEKNTWYGIVEAVATMFTWALSEVLLSIVDTKYFNDIGDKSGSFLNRISSNLLMQGLMGICCIFTFWIGIPILHFSGIEPFELPQNTADVLVLVLPACMDMVFVCALIIGISLTNPVFMAVAQLMVIPGGFLYDWAFNDLTISKMAILGSVFIFIGFLIMELPLQKYIAAFKGPKDGRRKKTSALLHGLDREVSPQSNAR